jgi:hypothetical protein
MLAGIQFGGVTRVRYAVLFTWPAVETMQVTSLQSGGCNIKFVFADRGVVRSIGRGQIVKLRNIPTKRIAKQYEIIILHDGDFQSNYSIIDQTPNLSATGAGQLISLGTIVDGGGKLYEVRNGGILHFQLFRAGKLVDPREYIRAGKGSERDGSDESPAV